MFLQPARRSLPRSLPSRQQSVVSGPTGLSTAVLYAAHSENTAHSEKNYCIYVPKISKMS